MGEDVTDALKELYQQFPELPKSKLELIYSNVRDKDDSLYRLICEEEGRSSLNSNLTVQVTPRSSSTTYPQHNNTPRSAGLSSPQVESLNIMTSEGNGLPYHLQPSCEYCGKQLSRELLSSHMIQFHKAEVEEFKKLQRELQPSRFGGNKLVVPDALCQKWGAIIWRMVIPVLEDGKSYIMRMNVLKSLEVMIKPFYKDSKIYLFGSRVTGLAMKDSDTDAAVCVSGVPELIPIDETTALENIYHMFISNPSYPWPSLNEVRVISTEDVGLRKILRTRVPILGNNPGPKAPLGSTNVKDVVLKTIATEEVDQLMETQQAISSVGAEVEKYEKHENSVQIKCKNEFEAIKMLAVPNCTLLSSKVPPLVFGTKWDLSCRLYGVQNSNLLRKYLSQRHVRIAAAAIKLWSKKCRINDPRVGLLSSYAVAMMYIYFLIRTDVVEWIDPESITLEECPNIPPFSNPPGPSSPAVEALAGKLFVGFIAFYSEEFNWEEHVVSINSPNVITKEKLGWTKTAEIIVERGSSIRYDFCIEDPYEMADPTPWGKPRSGRLNVTRKITAHRSLIIHKKIIAAFRYLQDPETNHSKLF